MPVTCPQVKTCCFYISLRTGAKVFGFVSLLGCVLTVILMSASVIIRVYGTKRSVYDKETLVILYIDILVQLVHTATSVLLLLSVYQKKTKFILPWLISTVVIAVLEVVFLPSFIGRLSGHHYYGSTIDWLLLNIFMIIDDVYGCLVVYSYYRTLTEQGGNAV